MGNELSAPAAKPPGPCKIVVRAPPGLGGGDVVTLASDPNETWAELCRRAVEEECFPFGILRFLLRLHPQRRLAAYRLRYDVGYGTIVRPTWRSDDGGGIGADLPLAEDAFVDVNVFLRPSVRNNGRKEVPESDCAPHLPILSALGEEGARTTTFVDLRWEVNGVDGTCPFPLYKDRTRVLRCAEHPCLPGWVDGCTLGNVGEDDGEGLPERCVNFIREGEDDRMEAEVDVGGANAEARGGGGETRDENDLGEDGSSEDASDNSRVDDSDGMDKVQGGGDRIREGDTIRDNDDQGNRSGAANAIKSVQKKGEGNEDEVHLGSPNNKEGVAKSNGKPTSRRGVSTNEGKEVTSMNIPKQATQKSTAKAKAKPNEGKVKKAALSKHSPAGERSRRNAKVASSKNNGSATKFVPIARAKSSKVNQTSVQDAEHLSRKRPAPSKKTAKVAADIEIAPHKRKKKKMAQSENAPDDSSAEREGKDSSMQHDSSNKVDDNSGPSEEGVEKSTDKSTDDEETGTSAHKAKLARKWVKMALSSIAQEHLGGGETIASSKEGSKAKKSDKGEKAESSKEQLPKKMPRLPKKAKVATDVEESSHKKKKTAQSETAPDDLSRDVENATIQSTSDGGVGVQGEGDRAGGQDEAKSKKRIDPKPKKEPRRRNLGNLKHGPVYPTGENDGHVPAEPAEGLPCGWTQRRTSRPNGAQKDTAFYSPQNNYKFRSKAEVRRFLEALKEAGGDEAEAIELHKRRGRRKLAVAVGAMTAGGAKWDNMEISEAEKVSTAEAISIGAKRTTDGESNEANGEETEKRPSAKIKPKKDAKKLKKPLRAFNFFSREIRPTIVKENP